MKMKEARISLLDLINRHNDINMDTDSFSESLNQLTEAIREIDLETEIVFEWYHSSIVNQVLDEYFLMLNPEYFAGKIELVITESILNNLQIRVTKELAKLNISDPEEQLVETKQHKKYLNYILTTIESSFRLLDLKEWEIVYNSIGNRNTINMLNN